MATELKVPESGESITEVQIAKWRKTEGEHVDVDEVVVEIETDKAAIDLPAPVSGTLSKILKKDGEEAGVGEVIGLIDESTDGAGKSADEEQKQPSESEQRETGPAAAEKAEAPARESGDGQPRQEEKKPAEKDEGKPAAKQKPEVSAARVMPSAQRLLAHEGIDAREIKPSGPGGRLLKEDVQRHLERTRRASRPEARDVTPEPHPERGEPARPEAEPSRGERVAPMSPMRKSIARNLVTAQQTAALLTTFNEIDMSEVMRLRKQYQEQFQTRHGVKLGFMSFFIKASVSALQAVPQVNAQIRDEKIVYFDYQDIGVAVGAGKGLVVPVLRNAERMGFAEIERAIADFAQRAQTGQIEMSELKGGTFTISNGGIYGSMLSTPIVNTPQSGILGLHAIQERAVVQDGQVVVRPMMYVALTYDHRLVDGREAVTFLRHIKEVIEEPVRLLIGF